jgi:hypothetical protein
VSLQAVAYILSGLGLVVVVLTRVRLRKDDAAGRARVPASLLNLHTGCGIVGLAAWVTYLAAPDDSRLGGPLAGIIAIAFLWVTSVCGLVILLRWLPTHGKHANAVTEDTWTEGPGLSVLAHVGMFLGVCFFTIGYMLGSL